MNFSDQKKKTEDGHAHNLTFILSGTRGGTRGPSVGELVDGGRSTGVVTSVRGSVVTIGFPNGAPTGPIELPWVRTTVVVEHSTGVERSSSTSVGDLVPGGGVITFVDDNHITIEFPGGAPSGPIEIPGFQKTVVIEHPTQTENLAPSPGGASWPDDYSEVDEDGVPTGLIAAVLRPPAGWPGTLCDWLLEGIDRLLNGSPNGFPTTGLKERYNDLRRDPKDLFHKQPTGPKSYESHQVAFLNQQKGALRYLEEWANKNCDDNGGPDLPADLVEWLTIKVPEAPDSVLPSPPAQPSLLDRPLPSLEEIAEVVTILGLGSALLGEILAALLAPNPVAKLAALGLAAVTIVALLTQLGYMAPVVA